MDNMAYLQQISTTNGGNPKASPSGGNFLSKFLNIWTISIGSAFIIILIIVFIVVGQLNKVDNKDQDLLRKSYWMSYNLVEKTMSEYEDLVKNSDIRDMSATFKAILGSIILNDANFLNDVYGIEVGQEEEGPEATEESEKVDILNSTLEEGRLSGLLDRVYLREMTMQVAYIQSYQSEIAERAKDENVIENARKTKESLQELYNRFSNFNSPTV